MWLKMGSSCCGTTTGNDDCCNYCNYTTMCTTATPTANTNTTTTATTSSTITVMVQLNDVCIQLAAVMV